MKYIVDLPQGGWDLQQYFHYLSKEKDGFPLEVFAFASDSKNYDLESHQSLHDAWLESLCITEPATGSRSEMRQVRIDCKFLGPYHDLYIHTTYFGVNDYSLTSSNGSGLGSEINIGHGDLLMHEVTLNRDNHISHELVFSRGSVFKISCIGFSHRIEPIEASDRGNEESRN